MNRVKFYNAKGDCQVIKVTQCHWSRRPEPKTKTQFQKNPRLPYLAEAIEIAARAGYFRPRRRRRRGSGRVGGDSAA